MNTRTDYPNQIRLAFYCACVALLAHTATAAEPPPLEQTFTNPTREGLPADSQIGVFWFWANTVTREGIHRDLEEMKRAGSVGQSWG